MEVMVGMRQDKPGVQGGRTSARGLLAVALIALTTTAVAGCSTHDESVQNPCPQLSRRGAVALAKLGLTPQELEQQEKC
jgi:hypothetical protein